jgi:hypothetical protein
MIEFVHTFQSGVMNKDLDERLVPNGQYRDALNIEVSTSESSNIGAIENIDGNLEINNKSYNIITEQHSGWLTNYITSLTQPTVIGGIRYDQEEKIYWLIASEGISVIAEYDQRQDIVVPVVVDTQNILKFSKDYLVTGINVIEGLLFFTENNTEPKKINIADFKAGSTDFVTHSTYLGSPFTESDVTVIKKSPLSAPVLNMASSKFGNNVLGTQFTPASLTYMVAGMPNFTYVLNTVDEPEVYISLETYAEWVSKTNNGTDLSYYADSSIPNWNGKVVLTLAAIPGVWSVNDIIELKGSFVNDANQIEEYQVNLLIESILNNQFTCQIQAISSNITRSFDSSGNVLPIVWEASINEGDPMFRLLFPRFAYRWKYKDGEYSCFSPFTNVAFLGDEFKYVATDGYNIGMTNNIRKLILEQIDFGQTEVVEVDILYKESHNTNVYVVDTIKKSEAIDNTFEIKSEVISILVESNQILRHWDNVPRKALSQEIIGNRLVYGNYLQNYNISNPVNLLVSESIAPHPGNIIPTGEDISPDVRKPFPSIKSIRTYQAGVVFADAYGRETPVFTSKNASYKVEKSSASYVNKLQVTPTNLPPSWATHYKIFVKETSNEYYNLALDRFYPAEDGNIWLSFPSSERNKVDIETYLILKKQHNNDTATEGVDRYKILAIENEAPEFISTFKRSVAISDVAIKSQIGQSYLFIEFDGPTLTANAAFAQGFTSDNFIKIIYGGNSTGFYRIASGGRTGNGDRYNVTLSEPLESDASFLDALPLNTDIRIEIYTNRVEKLPEFEGRFFVKINRDFAFETNIIEQFNELSERYGIIGELLFKGTGPSPNGDHNIYGESSRFGLYYTDEEDGQDGSDRKLKGINGWGGVSLGPAIVKQRYEPPTIGNRWFGFQWVGHGDAKGTFLNSTLGFAGNGLRSSKLVPGAYIRFKNTATGELGQIYKIVESSSHEQQRAKVTGVRTKSGMRRTAYLIKLDREIVDDFLPDPGPNGVIKWQKLNNNLPSIQVLEKIDSDDNKLLTSTNPAIFETEPKEAIDLNLYNQVSNALPISEYNNTVILDWHNCYSYGNGVESNRIRDDYNQYIIDKGPKVSTVLDEPYGEERRGSGMIFSQIFNSISGVNRLNQFIQALPITKDLNPIYGTIQKLHARDTDLISLCEDKCLRILANKDALFNADGNVNVTSNSNVLGQAVPYVGEYGISKNPESFASYGFRSYFSDKNRGVILRLSADGLTEISSKGMSDFFSDNLRVNRKIIGSYDDDKNLYNVTLGTLDAVWQAELSPNRNTAFNFECSGSVIFPETSTTISFNEGADGWTSRKSFIPEFGVSLNNTYFTFKNGRIWQHGANPVRNNFYNTQYDSSFNAIINDSPISVKSFKTLNYTGTQSRKYKYTYNGTLYSLEEVVANQIIPTQITQTKNGWYVNYISTDLEGGIVKEFVKKENKWFNYIKSIHEKENCNPANILSIGNPVLVTAEDLQYNVTITINTSCSLP